MIDRRAAIAGALASLSGPPRFDSAPKALSADSFSVGFDEFRLIDVVAPDGRGRANLAAALADVSRRALQERLQDVAPDELSAGMIDRWGRRVVRLSSPGRATSIQEDLVAAGAVRVRPESGDARSLAALLAAEARAREERAGLWSLSEYGIFRADQAETAIGAFNLVEGVVVSAGALKGRLYLNFGEDYRDDFTVTAPSRAAKSWATNGLDLAALEGARLRVRGFVERINGPSIETDQREAIERLES